jgi:hypothetical protein
MARASTLRARPGTVPPGPTPHADGLLIGHIPDARLGFVTDLRSPGRAALPERLDPPGRAGGGREEGGIAPARFAGGPGGVGDYAALAAIEGK